MTITRARWSRAMPPMCRCGAPFWRGQPVILAGPRTLCLPCGAPLERKALADEAEAARGRADARQAARRDPKE